MPQQRHSSPKLHTLFWVGGVAAAVLPFFIAWSGGWRAPWVLGPGYFADNLVRMSWALLIGGIIGGCSWSMLGGRSPADVLRTMWREPVKFNWIWFGLSWVVYSAHNILVLVPLQMEQGALYAAALGRSLTALVILAILWKCARLASLAAPKKLRAVPWFIPGVLPGFLGADIYTIILWKNSTKFMVNKVDESGFVDFGPWIAAAGFSSPVWVVLLGFFLVGLLLFALCGLAARCSQYFAPRAQVMPTTILIFLGTAWVLATAEKAVGMTWKSRRAQHLEHYSYNLHITPLKPAPGLVRYSVQWREDPVPALGERAHTARPDIYFVVIESLRDDALSEMHSPVMSALAREEAQDLGTTWAASNATHLSWYSLFRGESAWRWQKMMRASRNKAGVRPALLVEALLDADYQTHFNAVCDLSYNGMALSVVGNGELAEKFVGAPVGSTLAGMEVAAREKQQLVHVLSQVQASSPGGNFHFVGIDAPHFGYTWPEDFPVPYLEYDESAIFNAYPDENDILRVKNRYLNAVAWADYQVGALVEALKSQGRYDDSLIIITGDHGEEFQESGGWFHASSLEPEQTRVPILMKWPAGTEAPARLSASHVDIVPSILDLLGFSEEVWGEMAGHSLLRPAAERTQVVMTHATGISGIAMTWERSGYRALFRYQPSYLHDMPTEIYLDELIGPEGSIELSSPAVMHKELQKRFGDAFGRLFDSIRVTE